MSDLISRQAAIDAIDEISREVDDGDGFDYAKWREYFCELPSAQFATDTNVGIKLGTNSAEVGTDCISRQAAIDIERNATVDTNPSHFEAHQKFTQFMDDAEVSSFGRWQWSNGFNTALTAVGIDLKKLPSVQPEIIRCKDCKWKNRHNCTRAVEVFIDDDKYCAWAERRTDE